MIDDLITLFFKQKSFTDEELTEFKETIIDTIGFKEFKPYENRLSLELLKFKLTSSKTEISKPINNPKPKKKKKAKGAGTVDFKLNYFFIGKQVDKLASNLEISNRSMISALSTRGFEVDYKTILVKEMIDALEPFIKKRINAISRKDKKSSISLPPTKGQGTKYTDSVYDKIKLNQGIGKLIYIRKN